MAAVLPLPDGAPGMEIHLEEFETALLRSLAGQMVDLVGFDDDDVDPLAALVGIDPYAAPSDDPALRRLLPDAFMDDEDASGEFRRFTERDLRSAKVRNAEGVFADLEDVGPVVVVADDRIPAWLGFLNDARLILGTRIGVTEENHDELNALPEDDPRAALVGLYGWLTYLQESLVQTLLGPAPS